MDVNECLDKRILRKIFPNSEKSKSSLRIAEAKLEEARRLFVSDFFSNSVLSVYTSMFHAVRSLLYRDGIQEKSHYATYVYIAEKYSSKVSKNLLNSFNFLREERHEILYGFEEKISQESAENALLDAEEFLMEIKKILENEK